MVKILVTGGAGFIGSNIVRRALERGWEVRVLDNLFLGSSENLKDIMSDIEFLRGDVRDEKIVKKAVRGVDFIFHQAAASSSQMFVPDPGLGISVNIIGFANILRHACEEGVKRVIHASTSTIYGSLPTPFREDMHIPRCGNFYSMTKFAAEHLAKTYTAEKGLETVGLRYFSVYGPGERPKGKYANLITQFVWGMKKGERPVIYGDGTQTRDFIHVNDVVRANLLAAQKKGVAGEVFNVGTGKPISVNNAAELLNEYLGTDIKPIYKPNPIVGYVYKHQADTTKAKRMLGFEAKIPFEKGLKMLIECY
ncbi:MAG: NAD-dependent epimerase/dehydratase family protein [Candidatus Hadarchaeales archaeon]